MTITRKINRLHQLLIKEKTDYEQMAGRVTDNGLRCTILSLAQQNNQYAAELSSYMQSVRTPLNTTKTATVNKDIFPGENRVLAFCSSNEKKLVVAYRRILLEPTPYEGLQKMMDYQLNGILSATMQLKLLSAVRTRNAH